MSVIFYIFVCAYAHNSSSIFSLKTVIFNRRIRKAVGKDNPSKNRSTFARIAAAWYNRFGRESSYGRMIKSAAKISPSLFISSLRGRLQKIYIHITLMKIEWIRYTIFSQTRLLNVCAAGNFALTRSLRGARTTKNFFGSCNFLQKFLWGMYERNHRCDKSAAEYKEF